MGLLTPSAVPSDVRDEIGPLASEFEALRRDQGARIQRMCDYRGELTESRTADIDTDIGTLDYGRRRDSSRELRKHRIPLPYGRALTVKHSNRIAGRLPDVIVERREETPQERHRSDTIEKILWGIFRESDAEQQISSASWDSSELGAGVFDVWDNIGKGMPEFRSIDPVGFIPVTGVGDPHDFRRAYRFWREPLPSVQNQYRSRDFRGTQVAVDEIFSDNDKGVQMVTLVQMCDQNRLVRFALGKSSVPLYERVHNYGFVPYVVIPNLGPERDVWGWSDYEFVRTLTRYLPLLLSREADILRAVAGGAVTMKGVQHTTDQVKRILAEGGVIPVGKDGSIDPVATPDVPNFEAEHAQRVMAMIRDLGFAPDAAWGDGNAGSGSDRGLQLAPMFELTQMKQKNWASGLSRLASMLLRVLEQKQVTATRFRGVQQRSGLRRNGFNITIGPDVAPVTQTINQDTADEQEIELPRTPRELFDGDYAVCFRWANRVDPDDPAYVASELNKFAQGVQSLRTTLERLGVQAPEDEIKLIEQENQDHPWLRQGMIKLLEMQFNAQQQGAGGGGDQRSAADLTGGAVDGMTTKDGAALNADAGTGALKGGVGTLYGAA